MTEKDAKSIGSRQGLISVASGLLIAQLIMTAMMSIDRGFPEAFFWFMTTNYKLNIFIGILIMLLCGHFLGQEAGCAILIKKKNAIVVGILCGIGVLLTTAFISGWTGYIHALILNTETNNKQFENFLINPFKWVSQFGAIPAVIVGIWFGRQVRLKRE